MASVSLYVGIRSKVGQSHEINKTNIYIDGKAQDSARMTAGYENQFSCRKGSFGIAEGNEDGVRGSEAAKALLESLSVSSETDETLRQFLTAAEKTGQTRLALIRVQDGTFSLSGFGGMPAFLLRGHRMRPLPAAETGTAITMERLQLENKDRLLLCTRELVEFIEPAMLQTILDGREEPNQIAGELVAEAVKNGAKRDVTAIVVACEIVESPMTESLLDVDPLPEDTPEGMSGGAPWYLNKKLIGTVSVVGICVLAVAGVTLASVLSKKNTQPVAGTETQSHTVASEPLATITQPSTTEPQTTEPQTDEEDTTRETTTRRRTTAPAKNTTTKTTGNPDTTKPSESSTKPTDKEETTPSTTNDE